MTSERRRSSRSLLDQMELIAEEQSSSQLLEDDQDFLDSPQETENYTEEPMDDSIHNLFETVLENSFKEDLVIDMGYEDQGNQRTGLSDSAPALGSFLQAGGAGSHRSETRKQRQSIQIHSHITNDPRSSHASSDDSSRRSSIKVNSRHASAFAPSMNNSLNDSKSLISRVRKGTFLSRLQQSKRNFTSTNTANNPMIQAIHKLNNAGENDAAAAVSAAAAVVAASAQQRGFVQFGQGDYVLVMLTILERTDFEGDRDFYTIDPVNSLGFPKREGKTEAQRQGPYLYVLCKVTQVHFDEDERYYTVRRCDTGSEQRADPSFMERIRDDNAIEAAFEAAKRCKRTMKDTVGPVRAKKTFLQRVSTNCNACWKSLLQKVVPFYTSARNATKVQIKAILQGEGGYGISCHFSGVNFLVLCSFIFLFEDVFALAFLPSGSDQSATILGLYVRTRRCLSHSHFLQLQRGMDHSRFGASFPGLDSSIGLLRHLAH